jgi:uncharacterized protein (DUF1778 family)
MRMIKDTIKERKTENINMAITPEDKGTIRKLASDRHMNVTSFIMYLVFTYLKEQSGKQPG